MAAMMKALVKRHAEKGIWMEQVPVPEAGRRRLRRGLSTTEIPSPVRAADYVPPPRLYREVGPGHVVQAFDGVSV